ncbi:hypothetical protein [Halopelagius longus]|uniref:Uncharacterized protein n=1 Tax=Halopelagius longus TaxID=1236180 RepID=A0A1H0Y987_9EURY|nr:hypothetical protein [Halopelagius longus]RDI72351.1 hypothetical protein DWB78_11855 [Halopelagius longus]SDQ11623.1 hypothetical protein SAMN05216278_0483 [Halopelagius longus]
MKRRLFLLPAVLLLGIASSIVAFGPPTDPLFVALGACFAVSGGAFLVAGLRESVAVGSAVVPWYVFAGVGDIALGVGMLTNGAILVDGGGTAFAGVIIALTGPFLAFIGVDYLRGGVHFDVSAFE